MTSRFAEKLDRLPETVAMLRGIDRSGIETALASGRHRHAVAVGSGGSSVSAEFFARCRETLSHGPTSVETPMQFVLGLSDISKSDVWLFTAGGDNPDIVAAVVAAISRQAGSLNVLTRSPTSLAASTVTGAGGRVHVAPVSEEKDSYLATHALVGTVGTLLIAFDGVSGDLVGDDLLIRFTKRVREALSSEIRTRARKRFDGLDPRDALIVVADPQLRPVSALIETSAWEAALCPVQTTDFRNFSHGRHAWLHHRGDRTIMLALTGTDSRDVWQPLEAALPITQRRHSIDFGDCGRFSNAVGIIEGLVLIEAMGAAIGIDPGKPGIGPFGREMYENPALRNVARIFTSGIRQKRSAMRRRDDPAVSGISLPELEAQRLDQLAATTFGGIVLDYDGTIVSTDGRYGPPPSDIISELERLHHVGMRIGIATGRGGSAGSDLRNALDPSVHTAVLIGYYNGGYLRTLNVDIEEYPAPMDDAIAAAVAWLEDQSQLFRDMRFRRSGVQITIELDQLHLPERIAADLASCPPVAEEKLLVTRSGHSLDLVTLGSTKLNVVEAVGSGLKEEAAVLCIGDSGSRHGNDNALLANPFGISVGDVCGAPNGCWSLFGDHITGPSALLRVLRALIPSNTGEVRLDVAALTLDRR